MNLEILDTIPFRLDSAHLLKEMRIPDNSDYAEQLMALTAAAHAVACPKAAYRIAPVQTCIDKTVCIDGVSFSSRVLCVNLGQTNRVFAYVATCGVELEEWSMSIDGMLENFWADHIKEKAVYAATRFLRKHIAERYQPGRLSSMSPGSLPDWPISQQPVLFSLLGNTEAAVGVHLTPSKLMIPTKSVSGLLFPKEETFASCQLCPMVQCPNRKAPYNKDLFDTRYR